jgi:hypothetical protein
MGLRPGLEFGLQCRPRHALFAIVVEGCHAAFKFGPLRIGQGKLIVFETVPKLRNDRKSLRRRQTDNLVVGKKFHTLRIAGNCRAGKRLKLTLFGTHKSEIINFR